jgi:hypothetical protein
MGYPLCDKCELRKLCMTQVVLAGKLGKFTPFARQECNEPLGDRKLIGQLRRVWEILETSGPATKDEIAALINVKPVSAGTYLCRLHARGWVEPTAPAGAKDVQWRAARHE